MLRYRTFLNTDPPVLADIWRSRAGQSGLVLPISVDLLEQRIFAKPYFDHRGLILAADEDRPVGFAHAAFGPSRTGDRISTDDGVTCLVVVRPDCREAEAAAGLLRQSEAYLLGRGAKVLYGGAARPLVPFYFGLYGGSEPPGVLESDTVAVRMYRSHGYQEVQKRRLFRCRLKSFRPPVGRQQMQWRRRMRVEARVDPPARNWWEACITGDFDLTRFELIPRGGGPAVAGATFRSMESDGSAGRASGLIELEVDTIWRRQGLGTFLLAEAFRQLARQGVAGVEAQAAGDNEACAGLFAKLGLEKAGEGIVFRKEVDRS